MPQRHVTNEAIKGFTLVEISIVLVIIGMLIGGILVAQDLVHAAELRATVSQFEAFDAGVTTFRLKFNSLPGDMPNASDFGFDPTSNGNGDGYVGLCNSSPGCIWSVGNQTALEHEHIDFWYQLSFANVLRDHLVSYAMAGPPSPLGVVSPRVKITSSGSMTSGWGILSEAMYSISAGSGRVPAHSFVLGGGDARVTIVTAGVFVPADMWAIDSKIDDGLPLAGKVRGWRTITTDCVGTGQNTLDLPAGSIGAGGSAAAVCVRNDTTPSQYNVQYFGSGLSGHCGVTIKASF